MQSTEKTKQPKMKQPIANEKSKTKNQEADPKLKQIVTSW